MSKACCCSGAGTSNGVMVERDNLLRCVFSLIRIRNIYWGKLNYVTAHSAKLYSKLMDLFLLPTEVGL